MAGEVKELNDQNYKEELEKQDMALVDIYASWCGPCRLFSPIFEKVAQETDDLAFFKVDGDKNPAIRQGLTIDNLPYVAVFKNGSFEKGHSTSTEHGLKEFIQSLKGHE